MSARSKCSFSIEHILTVAGGNALSEPSAEHYEWLRCTRYHPPKLQRQRKKEAQRRNPGRNPRIPFSSSQVALLEAKFLQTPYLSSGDVTQLASCLNLSDTRVKIWFQNRRARERRERDGATSSSTPDASDTSRRLPATQEEERAALSECKTKVETAKVEHSPLQADEALQLRDKYLWTNLLFPISRNEHWRSVGLPIFMPMPPVYQDHPHQ